jgi:CheY-like chemotaxis protein
MAAKGPLVIIEDDADDQLLMAEVFADLQLPNPLIFFSATKDALHYLKTTTDQPFIIICDVNLPVQSGTELKREIDSNEVLRRKSIPFLFYSTAVSQDVIDDAYMNLNIQGFFKKGHNYDEIKSLLKCMVDYWTHCWHPNT